MGSPAIVSLLTTLISIIMAIITPIVTAFVVTMMLEPVKSKLNVLTNQRNQIFEEEKKIIIQFYSKYNSSFWYLYENPLMAYTIKDINKMKEKQETLITNKREIFDILSTLTLFVSDQSVVNKALELNKKFVVASNIHMSDLEKYSKIISRLKKHNDLEKDQYTFDNIEQKDFYDLLEGKDLLQEKQKEFEELRSEIDKLRIEFRDLVRHFLHKEI